MRVHLAGPHLTHRGKRRDRGDRRNRRSRVGVVVAVMQIGNMRVSMDHRTVPVNMPVP